MTRNRTIPPLHTLRVGSKAVDTFLYNLGTSLWDGRVLPSPIPYLDSGIVR